MDRYRIVSGPKQLKNSNELIEKRRLIRPLLSPSDPADALASYYALWHDPRRTQLTVHMDAQGRADGFIVICQTGADLFRPLITLRAPSDSALGELAGSALVPHRAYQILFPVDYAPAVRQYLELSQESLDRVYRLDAARFQPIVNVLVQRVAGPDGSPRFQIESQGQVVAMSGTNWRSPAFAEVFVYVHPAGRGRGWGTSVVSACTASLLEERLQPVYIVEQGNEASVRIAEELGYVDTGARQVAGECRLRDPHDQPLGTASVPG